MNEQTTNQQQMEGQGNQAQEPVLIKIKDIVGQTVILRPLLGLYSTTDYMGNEMPGLAIDLDMYEGPSKPLVPYARLTVNFGEFISIPNSAYIDTNNCPFADQLLAQGIAEATGLTKNSGFCTYPLWVFKEDFLQKIGGEEYQIYTQACDRYMSFWAEDEEREMPEEMDQFLDEPEQGMTMEGMSQ